MHCEPWAAVPGFEGLYEISPSGEVLNLLTGKRVAHSVGKNGYPKVFLRKDRAVYQSELHVILLEVFVGPRPPGYVTCHKDDNPLNFSLDNLRWGTRKDNAADAIRNGRTPHGERLPWSKLNAEKAAEIRRRLAAGETQKSIARDFGVWQSTIQAIAAGRTWKAVKLS